MPYGIIDLLTFFHFYQYSIIEIPAGHFDGILAEIADEEITRNREKRYQKDGDDGCFFHCSIDKQKSIIRVESRTMLFKILFRLISVLRPLPVLQVPQWLPAGCRYFSIPSMNYHPKGKQQ